MNRKFVAFLIITVLVVIGSLINEDRQEADEIMESLIPENFQPVLIFMNKYSEDTVIKRRGDDISVVNEAVDFIKDIDVENYEKGVYPECRYSMSLFNSVNEVVMISFNEDNSIFYGYTYKVKDKKTNSYHFEDEYEFYQISNSNFDIFGLEEIFSGLDDF